MESRAEVEEESGEAETRRLLRDAVPDFEVCARRAVECILAVPTYMPKGFSVSIQADPPASFACFIHAGNTRFSARLCLRLDPGDFKELMPGAIGNDMQIDALGEIANVIAGSFLGRKSFQLPFGDMLPSPPLFSHGASPEPKSWCINGTLKANGTRIFICFMIKSVRRDAIT